MIMLHTYSSGVAREQNSPQKFYTDSMLDCNAKRTHT